MEKQSPPKSLNELLDRLSDAEAEDGKVSLDAVMDAVGRRSFAPLLLVAGLLLAVPGVGDIPGVPTVVGVFTLLVTVQLLFGHDHFWLPQWLLKRSVARKKLRKTTESKWTRRPAKWIDTVVKHRMPAFTGPLATRAIALVCTVLALATPLTEFVPMSSVGVGVAIVAFGVSLIARDGLMALLGFVLSAVTIGLAMVGLK